MDNLTNINQQTYQLDEDYTEKVEASKQLSFSPNITILIPYHYQTEDELLKAYESYQYLGFKARLMSDEYSRQIWGYSVSDIFTFEKERLCNTDKAELESPQESAVLTEQTILNECDRVISNIGSLVASNDKIGLLESRIRPYYFNTLDEVREVYEDQDNNIMESICGRFDRSVWLEHMNPVVPYFTPDEMPNKDIGDMDYMSWKQNLIEAVQAGDADKIYNLGWNPSVELNEKSMEYAKERQLNWLEHKLPNIIDIQGISEALNYVNEGVDAKAVYREHNLYPVFIVLSYTGSVVGQVINKVKNSEWSHAGLSTDVSLASINSYNFRGKEYNGFTEDNLARYLKETGDAKIEVLCVFVDRKTMSKIKSTITDIKTRSNNNEGHYDFANIINMAFNRAKKFDYPQNIALVCSQFVDLVLRVANIELVNKPNNLVLPQDFSNISSKNPRVYKIFSGLARRYNEKTAENDIVAMIQGNKVENIIGDEEPKKEENPEEAKPAVEGKPEEKPVEERTWLESYDVNIIDATRLYLDKNVVTEAASSQSSTLYKENNLYPVFIVMSYNNKLAAKTIAFAYKSKWTHVGIATDSSLNVINSYNFRGKDHDGFNEENLKLYLNDNGDTKIQVACIFVDRTTLGKIRKNISNIKKRAKEGKYDFANLIRILFNRSKKFDYPDNLAMVCSQFTDLVLRLSGIELVPKSNNLVIPQDFSNCTSKPNVYLVYEGLANKYNKKYVDANIVSLITSGKAKNIIEDDDKKKDDKDKDSEKIIESLEILADLLEIEPITERLFPVKVEDNGDISIEYRKDLEQQYQETHKLLTTYTVGNLDGIKSELAHLFYLNSLIENKIRKMKKKNDNYKILVDLRARILNDFKKYIKVVNESDPSFNFNEYFKNSEYFNGGVTLDHGLMKLSGDIIKKFFTAIK